MDINSIKNGLTQKFGRTSLQLQKHSPEILLGVGIVGMVATVVMVAKAAKKDHVKVSHQKNIKDFEEVVKVEELTKQEEMQGKAVIYVQSGLELGKIYGPAIGVGLLSITAILASHGVMAKREVALVAAYNLLNEGWQNYRKRVVEELGEEKDRQFYLGLREEEYETEGEIHVNEDGTIEVRQNKKKKEKKTKLVATGNMPSVYARCFDNSNPMFQSDRLLNLHYIKAQQNYINDLLILHGYAFLNDAYERLGFPKTPEGQLVGWVLRSPEQMKAEKRDGYVSFGLDDPIRTADREFIDGTNDAIWLDFNVDGIVFNLI